MKNSFLILPLLIFSLGAAAQTEHQTQTAVQSQTQTGERVLKRKVAIGRFSNETQYSKGLFYDKNNDPLGKQALDILSSKLAASGKFLLLERSDLNQILAEVEKGENSYQSIGADYMIIGSITQFGRKDTGEKRVFSTTKSQMVEAGVSIRIVDVSNGLVIYSDEAKGEAELKTKSVMGMGDKAGYDASLSDKAISAAIGQLVENIINKCTDAPWRTYFLSYETDAVVIGGGATQGINAGDKFSVFQKGKKVKNPQNGLMIELPGKKVAELEVIMTGGDTPETEYSFVTVNQGNVDSSNLNSYYIQEAEK